MKFITFEVPTPLGNISRAGALVQVGDGQVVLDLAHGYAALLQEEDEEPRFREYADFRLPQDMCELMAGGGTISQSRPGGAGIHTGKSGQTRTERGATRLFSQ